MEVGFRLFAGLSAAADVYEVFPSAAYAQLVETDDSILSISLRGFARGPKDMLDAYVAAYTVHEYLTGRGCAVGGGDGLGEIILPRPISPKYAEVLKWPRAEIPPTTGSLKGKDAPPPQR
jgi:predicted nuclease with RNAse H fold